MDRSRAAHATGPGSRGDRPAARRAMDVASFGSPGGGCWSRSAFGRSHQSAVFAQDVADWEPERLRRRNEVVF
jgi:hypothetical protein